MSYRETKRRARELYLKMERTASTQTGDWIHFNRLGFQHLMRKGRKFRPKSEQMRRFALISHIPKILSDPNASFVHKIKKEGKRCTTFWIFKKKVDGANITVVVRKIGEGRPHFFSVY